MFRFPEIRFAGMPLELTLGLLVPDHQRKRYATIADLQKLTELTIGVVQGDRAFQRRLEVALPMAEIQQVDSPRAFLRGEMPDIDAVLYSAEGGSAWTLIYPNYSIVVPQPASARLPAGYIVPRGDDEWAWYVDEWVDLRRIDGGVGRLFDHWIQGGGAEVKAPRWSVIRDVLGWIE